MIDIEINKWHSLLQDKHQTNKNNSIEQILTKNKPYQFFISHQNLFENLRIIHLFYEYRRTFYRGYYITLDL
jgi:hypothetical protein